MESFFPTPGLPKASVFNLENEYCLFFGKPLPTLATMITAFNDDSFELQENLLDLGLQVFNLIKEQDSDFEEIASPLPPFPSVATNAPHNFIKPSSIKPSSGSLC
jgi:hypothetical protein